MRRMLIALASVAVVVSAIAMPAVAVASEPGAAAGRTIKIDGKSFEFLPNRITITAGERVTIVYHSLDGFHDLVVKGVGRVVKANGGQTRRGKLMIAKPGTYKFWCSVRGHRSAGMVGKIVVQ
jgi:plastocyanin